MAKINPIKTRQEAEKAEKAGKLDQAIPLYRQLLEDNPRDWNTINKIGDLLAKMGRMKEAGDEYSKVAEFYAKDGFHLKAIAIWKKINKLDPAAIEPYAKLADLYSKQGLMTEAKSQYQVVAEDYLKRGRNKDAGEVLRKLVELDPGDLKTRSRLADIYTREGAGQKAVQEYAAIAQELHLKGHPAEAIQVLEKGLKIDPSGTVIKTELGRVHLSQKAFDKAIAYFEEVTAADAAPPGLLLLGQAYLGARRISDAQTTLESILKRAPENQEARVILVQVYAALGRPDDAYEAVLPLVDQLLLKRDADRAQNMLAQIASRAPQHVRTLQKLVEVARVRQNDRAIGQALSALLEVHVAAGSLRAAQDTAQQLVDLEPSNEQFKARLESLKTKKADPAVTGPSRVSATNVQAPEAVSLPPPTSAFAAQDELGGMEFATGGILRAGAVASAPPDKEFVDEHLAEARVFRKYGLLDKSEEQVDIVLARFPYLFEARLERKEVYKETQRNDEAAAECIWLARDLTTRGEQEAAQVYVDEAEMLSPGSSAAMAEKEGGAGAGIEADAQLAVPSEVGMELAGADAESETTAPSVPAEAVHEEEDLNLEVSDDDSSGAELSVGAGARLDAAATTSELPDLGGLPDLGPEPSVDPATSFRTESLAPPPPDDSPLGSARPAADSDAALRAMGFGEEEESPGLELGPPEPPPSAAPPAAPVVDPELARTVEEIDSYVSLGFVDDAKDALRDALLRFPGAETLAERAKSLGLDVEKEADAASADAHPELSLADPPAAVAAPPDLGFDAPATIPDSPRTAPAAAASSASQSAADVDDAFAFLAGAEPAPDAAVTPAGMKTSVSAAAPVSAGALDLGAELSSLFDPQPAVADPAPDLVDASAEAEAQDGGAQNLGEPGLQDIFNEFKKGVDQALGAEDYDTRYNLGIAYKEMGLIDEAIAEFQLAAKDPKRALECSSMIGICFLEKGVPDVAIQWFEKGLKAPGRAAEEYRGLKYDLASAWEANGDAAIARQIFTELYAEDAGFRDVSDRVRSLKGR